MAFSPKLFENKVIIITGGGSGLGLAMATGFAQLGAKVVITGRTEEKLKKAQSELSHSGLSVFYGHCDIRQPDEIESLISSVLAEHGHIDGLINNAAGNFLSPSERLSPKGFKIITDIVLNGTFNMTHAIGTHWIKNHFQGAILNISTTYAESGSGFVLPSAAAKAGVNAITRSLAVEWAKYGIRINGIAPGPIPTQGAFSRLMPDPSWEQKAIDRIPMKRFGKKSELVNLAVFLMSDLCDFLTGEIIRMDGGEFLYGAGEFNHLDQIPDNHWESLIIEMRKRAKSSE